MPKMFVEEKYLRAKNIPTIEFLSSLRYALSYEINVINSSCQLKSLEPHQLRDAGNLALAFFSSFTL